MIPALMEETLVLLKPDCLEGRKCGEVLKRFEEAGFDVFGLNMMRLSDKIFRPNAPGGLIAVREQSKGGRTSDCCQPRERKSPGQRERKKMKMGRWTLTETKRIYFQRKFKR